MQRLVIMNGYCFLQERQADGRWLDIKISKAHGRRPGLYNLYEASPPGAQAVTAGLVLTWTRKMSTSIRRQA
jgi:hypothetical protein